LIVCGKEKLVILDEPEKSTAPITGKKQQKDIEKSLIELNHTRKLFINAERKVVNARIKLHSACGISIPSPKKTCITTLNQAQQNYVKARKSYIKAKIGILNGRAGLTSTTGTPIY